MNEGQLEFLKAHQREIGLKLLRFARWLAATKYGWDEQAKTLPLGKDPEDIVCEVIDDYLHDVRHFNPKHEMELQLRRAISSELWALHQRIEAKAISIQDENNEFLPCGYEAEELSPDGVAMVEHDWKVLFELFRSHPKVRGDEELEFLLMAVEDGAESAPKMAQQTGIAVERIYELLKKLRKYYPVVKKQFQKGTEILQ